jgi:uncharacterized membrane protein YdbT with pleckstrin-like domain
MAYIDELLGRGENILYEARQHLFVLVSRIFTKLILIGILVAAGVVSSEAFRHNLDPILFGFTPGEAIALLAGFISFLLLISIFGDYMAWNAEHYLVTDRRVIQIRGVLNKSVLDSSLERIYDISMTQGILGRLFNYATISISTAADDGSNAMQHVAKPVELKNAMLDAKHNSERGFGYLDSPQAAYESYGNAQSGQRQSVPSPQHHTIHQTLEELATLRDRGILSIDEFEAKKRELLNRI